MQYNYHNQITHAIYIQICDFNAVYLQQWRSGSAVECRTLDRENTVTNPLHISAVDGDSLWRCYATTKTKSLYFYFSINRDLLLFYLLKWRA